MITTDVEINRDFKASAAPAVSPQGLGMGPKAFDQLMEAERQWQAQSPDTRPIVSPLEVKQSQVAELQERMKANDESFRAVMQDQSAFEARGENGLVNPRSTPVMLALAAAGALAPPPVPAGVIEIKVERAPGQ